MTITTEEAELHRNQIEEVRLLRLAAERDALRAENARLREVLRKIEHLDRPQMRGLPRRVTIQDIALEALGEKE